MMPMNVAVPPISRRGERRERRESQIFQGVAALRPPEKRLAPLESVLDGYSKMAANKQLMNPFIGRRTGHGWVTIRLLTLAATCGAWLAVELRGSARHTLSD